MAARAAVPLALLGLVATTSAWCLTATPRPATARARALPVGEHHLGRPRRTAQGRSGAVRRAMPDTTTDAEITGATVTVAADVVANSASATATATATVVPNDSEEAFYEAELDQVRGAGREMEVVDGRGGSGGGKERAWWSWWWGGLVASTPSPTRLAATPADQPHQPHQLHQPEPTPPHPTPLADPAAPSSIAFSPISNTKAAVATPS